MKLFQCEANHRSFTKPTHQITDWCRNKEADNINILDTLLEAPKKIEMRYI